jgi:MFS family permease
MIRHEFHASDAQLGCPRHRLRLLLLFFGIPIAAWADAANRNDARRGGDVERRRRCGAATSFLQLLLARIGTGVGEAGGSPPSHSLIADYFAPARRGTALSLYAMAVPIGGMLGAFLGGWCSQIYGWRVAFLLVGLPGVAIALLVWLTVAEPTRPARARGRRRLRRASL